MKIPYEFPLFRKDVPMFLMDFPAWGVPAARFGGAAGQVLSFHARQNQVRNGKLAMELELGKPGQIIGNLWEIYGKSMSMSLFWWKWWI